MKSLGKTLNKIFGKAHIKNVPGSNERLNSIKNACEQIDMEFNIFAAFDGKKYIKPDTEIKHGAMEIKYPSSAGFIANQFSTQVILLNEICNSQSKSFMIFDDDCYFKNYENRQEDHFQSLENNLPEDWDIIILGTIDCEEITPINYTYSKIERSMDCAGCHGIAVNRKVYDSWLTILDQKQFWGDGTIDRLFQLGFNVYAINPGICAQNRKLFSDINQTYHQ
jgi:GR25 family glycosyltransferase involved in LPS biosynthesis